VRLIRLLSYKYTELASELKSFIQYSSDSGFFLRLILQYE